MTPGQQVVEEIKWAIATLPAADQQQAMDCYVKIRQLMHEYGRSGRLALALVGAEYSAE